jgi:membrane protease YdiL (CAAX protease family)
MGRCWNTVLLATAFEGALALVAVALAAWFELPLARRLAIDADVARRCAVAVIPMLALLWIGTRSRWGPLVELRRLVEWMVAELFGNVPWPGLAVVSIAAGLGEELLFRGALQPLASRWVGDVAGVAIVSVLFGALHAASRMYFFLAVRK